IIESTANGTDGRAPNTSAAVVEQVIYHGFATHLHLRMPNGDPLIAFEQNRPASDQPVIRPGMQVYARWNPESGQIVRDEPD
ncbi:MAG TPA: TOBE domain-containing protein, partial [Sphingomicrobium sp.]|nr:TOBE domain-containing protein [Sphingomicrobium sp.]